MLIWKNDEIATLQVAKLQVAKLQVAKAATPAPKKKQKATAKSAPKEPEIALPDADPAKAVKK